MLKICITPNKIKFMAKKDLLKKDIETIYKIYADAKNCYVIANNFYVINEQSEIDYINRDEHLKFIRQVMWKMCIIEINKLVGKNSNDKYRFETLINNLQPGGHYGFLKLQANVISKWVKTIKEQEKIIANIYKLRNQAFAHTDNDDSDLRFIQLKLNDIRNVLNIIEMVISDIFKNIFESGISFKNVVDVLPFKILKDLAAYRELSIAPMKKELDEIDKRHNINIKLD
jgi:hypothetical protein